MAEDNKTKNDYVSPMVLNTKDLVDIKSKAAENALLNQQDDVGVFELVEETYQKTYPRDLKAFVARVAKVREKDFWVVVAPKSDPMLDMLWVKNGKLTLIDVGNCPTPMLGMHVYHYSQKSGDYKLLWALPDEFHFKVIKDNIIDLASDLKDLIGFMYQYEDGTLLQLSNKLNGIDPNAPKNNLIIKLDNDTVQTDTRLKDNKKELNGRSNKPNHG